MIVPNGTFQYISFTGGGEDELGRPIEPTAEWSTPLPCRIQTNNDTRRGVYEDGQFRQATFSFLIEPTQEFPHKRVRLTRHQEELGEYKVITTEPLDAVGATRITVTT